MARETYELSYLTKDTLDDHVKAIADAGSYDKSYLYAILAGTVTDPYAKFRRLFRALAHVRPEQARLYIQDLRSLIPTAEAKGRFRLPIKDGLVQITKAYLDLMAIPQGDVSGEERDELNAGVQRLATMCNKLLNELSPQRPMAIGG